jgi:hypothetical protein
MIRDRYFYYGAVMIAAVLAAIILAVFLSAFGTSLKAEAGTDDRRGEKTVSVVSVKEGDTIWSIAADFYTEDYKNMNELVDEIKSCNGSSDRIFIGQKLFVPHYREMP